jgi:hypothetical protein
MKGQEPRPSASYRRKFVQDVCVFMVAQLLINVAVFYLQPPITNIVFFLLLNSTLDFCKGFVFGLIWARWMLPSQCDRCKAEVPEVLC